MGMDSARLARLKANTTTDLVRLQRKAAAHLNGLYDEKNAAGDAKWSDSTVRDRMSLQLVQASLAAERAQTMATTPQQLGVVVVHARMEDTPQNRLSWEQQAARLNDSRAIEAVAVPVDKKPGEAA